MKLVFTNTLKHNWRKITYDTPNGSADLQTSTQLQSHKSFFHIGIPKLVPMEVTLGGVVRESFRATERRNNESMELQPAKVW